MQLCETLDRVLPAEDADVSKAALRGFKQQGIKVHTATLVTDVDSGEGEVTFAYGAARGGAEWLVIAAGRGLEGGYPKIVRIVHGHPTLSDGVMEAARAADGAPGPRVTLTPHQHTR